MSLSTGYLNDLVEFDPLEATWAQVEIAGQLPPGRKYMGVAAAGSLLCIFRGITVDSPNSVNSMTTESNAFLFESTESSSQRQVWVEVTDPMVGLPSARFGLGMTSTENSDSLYLFGGQLGFSDTAGQNLQ
jgi:hypothetical protein